MPALDSVSLPASGDTSWYDWATALDTDVRAAAEIVMDVLGTTGLVAGANVTLTYNDTANTITIASSAAGGGGMDAEAVMDLLGTTGLVEGAGIDIAYNDAAGTITLTSTATAPATFSGGTPGLVPDGTAAGATAYLNGDGGWTVPAGGGGSARQTQIFTVPGPLAPAVGTSEFLVTLPGDIVNVWASLTAAGTGASVLVDVNINGTTIFTTQSNRPTIAAAAQRDLTGTPDAAAADFVSGDRITVDVDQVGTHAAAVQLTIGIEYTYD